MSQALALTLAGVATALLVIITGCVAVLLWVCRNVNAQALQAAERIVQSKSVFFASVSHEIRTPLNAIIVLLGLLLKSPLGNPQKFRVERANTAARHLMGVVNDILDYSRIEAGRMQIEQRPFEPSVLLDDLFSMFDDRAAQKGLCLTFVHTLPLPVLVGDPLRISQILVNFVGNAIQFSDGGEVLVSLGLRETPDGLMLHGEVTDQGSGLEPAKINHIFEPFEQAELSIARRYGGTGLGLAICRRLAMLMGGQVGVNSTLGLGSSFWFDVAVTKASGAMCVDDVPEEPAMRLTAEVLRSLRILLIDDNELNRLVSEELLLEWGVSVDLAESGLDAMVRLEQNPPDHYSALLIDLMMPGLDGYETTRMIRANPAFDQLPIIALSAEDEPRTLERCLDAGMNGHVAKPLDADRLWDVLIQCLVIDDPCSFVTGSTSTDSPFMQAVVPDQVPGADLFDPLRLDRLKSKVSAQRFEAMLRLLLDDCRKQVAMLGPCAASGDFQALRQHTHDLCSTAGHSGMPCLADLARELLRAIDREDPNVGLLVTRLETLAHESIQFLQSYIVNETEDGVVVE